MSYIGKTNWQNTEIVYAPDMNRIEQGIKDLDTGKQNALGFTPVPNTRKVNNKTLNSDITLTQDDVGNGTTNKVFTATEKSKLSNIAENANAYEHPNHSGDVTSAGDGSTTISNNKVTNAKLAQMPAKTIKGNNTAGAANAKDLTVAETKVLLDIDDLESQITTKAVKILFTSVTISTAWAGTVAPYTQDVTVTGMTADDEPHIMPVYSETLATAQAQEDAYSMISKAVSGTNKITFTCHFTKPTTAIPIEVEVIR